MYTAVTGIWQTVWLEPVNRAHIKSLTLTPRFDESSVRIEGLVHGAGERYHVQFEVKAGPNPAAKESFKALGGSSTWEVPFAAGATVRIPEAKPWTPDSPFLYDVQVTLFENDKIVDQASSYFGMRKIALGKDEKGTLRLCLNNKPLFQYGPLDQGWWPDGLYTAPTDEALKYDIEVTKELGMNMARKHVKVEPDRWYYWCDKLGLLVWQDMPSGDRFIGARTLISRGPRNPPSSSIRS
jgi:beta-galactosidase/beta-glucuronidase